MTNDTELIDVLVPFIIQRHTYMYINVQVIYVVTLQMKVDVFLIEFKKNILLSLDQQMKTKLR